MLTETRLSQEIELYGLMAQFSQPEPLLGARGAPMRRATATWTRIRPCRWKACRKLSASGARGCSVWYSWADFRSHRRIHAVLVDDGDRVSAHRGRKASE